MSLCCHARYLPDGTLAAMSHRQISACVGGDAALQQRAGLLGEASCHCRRRRSPSRVTARWMACLSRTIRRVCACDARIFALT